MHQKNLMNQAPDPIRATYENNPIVKKNAEIQGNFLAHKNVG